MLARGNTCPQTLTCANYPDTRASSPRKHDCDPHPATGMSKSEVSRPQLNRMVRVAAATPNGQPELEFRPCVWDMLTVAATIASRSPTSRPDAVGCVLRNDSRRWGCRTGVEQRCLATGVNEPTYYANRIKRADGICTRVAHPMLVALACVARPSGLALYINHKPMRRQRVVAQTDTSARLTQILQSLTHSALGRRAGRLSDVILLVNPVRRRAQSRLDWSAQNAL